MPEVHRHLIRLVPMPHERERHVTRHDRQQPIHVLAVRTHQRLLELVLQRHHVNQSVSPSCNPDQDEAIGTYGLHQPSDVDAAIVGVGLPRASDPVEHEDTTASTHVLLLASSPCSDP